MPKVTVLFSMGNIRVKNLIHIYTHTHAGPCKISPISLFKVKMCNWNEDKLLESKGTRFFKQNQFRLLGSFSDNWKYGPWPHSSQFMGHGAHTRRNFGRAHQHQRRCSLFFSAENREREKRGHNGFLGGEMEMAIRRKWPAKFRFALHGEKWIYRYVEMINFMIVLLLIIFDQIAFDFKIFKLKYC